jgi:glycosyltransferase involved in cell wall biosynthesis
MQIFLDTSHTSRSGARTGIQSVVRGLIAGLSSQCEVHALRWSFHKSCLTPLKPKWQANLDHLAGKDYHLPWPSLMRPGYWPLWAETLGMDYRAPIHRHPAYAPGLKGKWLILPELMEGKHVRFAADYARKHGMRVAGIFYDAIPWLHPEIVLHWTSQEHADYMTAFAGLDVVIPISGQSARDYKGFAQEAGLAIPPVKACSLASQIFGQERETKLKEANGGVVKILYVSTLEPRKNHDFLLTAFENACSRVGDRKIELHLVGGVYTSAPEIAEAVQAAAKRNPAIIWHGKASNGELRDLYRQCDFTVYASRIEGFGLPVMESMWFGRPCLCSDEGVIAENAAEGGCLTVDLRDKKALADALVRLSTQPELRRELGEQVLRRKLKSWDQYAGEILGILKGI